MRTWRQEHDEPYQEQSGLSDEAIAKLDALLDDLRNGAYDDYAEIRGPFVGLLAHERLKAIKEAEQEGKTDE
jgi:hypothetical protein